MAQQRQDMMQANDGAALASDGVVPTNGGAAPVNNDVTPAVTRFAPSPTGYIHIGNVRSAIYPWLLARQTGGKFILRIEDTDQQRFVEGATEKILETLRWLGLNWDEGPEAGGENGPYFQSERKKIYHKWARQLIASGRAYADPTSSEQIQKYREADNAAKIPYLYRNHRPENTPEWHEGLPLRFCSDPQERHWHDEVMGDLHAGPEVQDDIILIKADGLPTYNFAHIVDDAKMGVNYVIRGVEYLSSVPNYLAIYEALGLTVPKLVSLPHILAATGNKKLSKRDGAKSVTDYRDEGILPEAMLNYLACLGWNDGTEQEIYTVEELLERFSLDRIQNSGARFDEVKLLWMNGQWIRRIATGNGTSNGDSSAGSDADSNASPSTGLAAIEATTNGIQELFARTADFWPEAASKATDREKMAVLAIIYDRLKTLSDLREMTNYFFEEPKVDLEMLTKNKNLKKFTAAELANFCTQSIEALKEVKEWQATNLQEVLNKLLADLELKPGQLFTVIRIALSYAPFSPALPLTMEVLGRERTLRRLEAAVVALGDAGGRQ